MNNNKTILFTYPSLFNPRVGGVERVTDVLARALISRGFNVIYLHNKKNSNLSCFDYPAPLYYFPNENNYFASENYLFYHNFLKKYNVDIVINQSGQFCDSKLYLSIGNNTNVKTISILHLNPLMNYDYLKEDILTLKNDSFKEYFKLIARFLIFPKIKKDYWENRKKHYNFLFENTDVVCLLSQKFQPELERIYSGSQNKVIFIGNPNSCEVSTFVKNKEKIILYVGRLDKKQKRPDRLLSIWEKIYKEFSDWQLIFIGDGSQRKELERKAKKMDRVLFTGYRSPDEYYKKAAILCLTSNYEGFGMVLTEAMQYGVVPVAFNSYSSVSDIITDLKNGFLIKPFDLREYAFKLSLLMSDENKRLIMAHDGFLTVKRFDINNIVDQWENLFNKLDEK